MNRVTVSYRHEVQLPGFIMPQVRPIITMTTTDHHEHACPQTCICSTHIRLSL